MKKLLKGKDGDSSRNALFNSSKPKPSSNPYADGPANDPYASNNGGGAPPPYSSPIGSSDRLRAEKSPVPQGAYSGGPPAGNRYGGGGYGGQQDRYGGPPPGGDRYGGPPPGGDRYGGPPPGGDGYGGPPPGASPGPQRQREDRFGPPSGGSAGSGGYAQGSYGNTGGFGQDRYGGPPQQGQQGSRYGAGGYGGFGNAGPAQPNSAARDQLFASNHQQVPPPGPEARPANDWASGRGPGYGGADNGYAPYEQRQLTAEEQEEEDVQAAKQEIRFLKQQDVASTRNALRIAQQAEEQGRSTLERLGAQGESIHNTERNLDLASNQNRLAQEKARELKTLNRSMFAVHVANPFTSAQRTREREEKVLDDARRDRDEREQLRSAAWGTNQRQNELARDMAKLSVGKSTKQSLNDRAKYQFEADSEDEEMENEIDKNMDLLHGAAKRLNHLAGAMGREVDIQNQHLDRIGGKVDRVDDEIALNRSRLDRIK